MASRGKKKTSLNIQNQPVITKDEQLLESKMKSVNFRLNLVLTLAFLCLFIFIMLMPILTVDISFDASKYSDAMGEEVVQEGEYKVLNATVSILDVIIAPLRGVKSGLEFLMEKADFIAKSDLANRIFKALSPILLGEQTLNTLDDSSKALFAFSIIIFALTIMGMVSAIIERNKFIDKYLATTIIGGMNFLTIFVLFIIELAAMIKTGQADSKVQCEWGLWLIMLVSAFLFGYLIYHAIMYKKLKSKKEIKNEKVS